jgi:hypothetical protein
MQTVGLTWQHSFEVAGVVAVLGTGLHFTPDRRLRTVGAFLREAAVIGVLYGLWQLAGRLSVTGTQDAMARGRWIARAEHDVGLPSEHHMEQLILWHRFVAETANLYYATMHFTMMFVFLIWLFFRHREQYRPVRQVMAWTTLGCLLIQLMPVAPPRMFPDLGIKDVAALFDQSVYSGGFAVDQMSAMPSVHVAWAVIVGYYTWKISPSRWRFIGPLHSALTVFVVVSTGNHWWADGIVAVAVLVIVSWAVFGVRTGWRAAVTRYRRPSVAVPEPELTPA